MSSASRSSYPTGKSSTPAGRRKIIRGYDLTGILVGSEGTLGIVTKIIVRLMRKTEAVKTLMAVFESMDDASHTVSDVIGRGIVPAAIEMMDQFRHWRPWKPTSTPGILQTPAECC